MVPVIGRQEDLPPVQPRPLTPKQQARAEKLARRTELGLRAAVSATNPQLLTLVDIRDLLVKQNALLETLVQQTKGRSE